MTESGKQAEGQRRLNLARSPAAAGEARRFVERLLRRSRVSVQARDTAMLVSSELVTNAVKHGQGRVELRVNVLEDRVRIEVIDAGSKQAPAVRQHEPDETGGWGLRIVDQLAMQWGVFDGTTHVWADLALA
jgi:anti-sigma regulatory factor (Ser/Thr protein kinase)